MTYLSLFNGMSCGYIAASELGLPITKYYSSEIDKHAIKAAQAIHPDTIQLGDITKWQEWDIDWRTVDIVLAGSPCQGFSFAGKQLAFDDPRSKLFFVFVDILGHIQALNPKVLFLLENVRMKAEHENVISRVLNIAPIMINSALVSAQNRVRLYWTNIHTAPVGLFGDMQCHIPQPADRGILLRDILETNVPEKYYLSDAALNRAFRKDYSTPLINPVKSGTINTKNNSPQCSFDGGSTFILNTDGKPKPNQNKASCITGGSGHGAGNHSDMDLICVSMVGRKLDENGTRKDNSDIKAAQQLEPRQYGKTGCLTSVQKDNLIMQLNPSTESGGVQPYQQNRVYSTDGIVPSLSAELTGRNNILEPSIEQRGRGYNKGGIHTKKSPPLTSHSWQNNHSLHEKNEPLKQIGQLYDNGHNSSAGRIYLDDGKSVTQSTAIGGLGSSTGLYFTNHRIRRLTPRECGRLQTVPEHILDKLLISGISDTQLYRMFGNGWTVEVIKHILSYINQ